jgi:hypothetical protein
VAAVDAVVHRYDLRRTILAKGGDPPGPTVPAYCSFGAEGTPVNIHLLPTIGVDGAPETLHDPAFGLDSTDLHVMHAELLAYTELVNRPRRCAVRDRRPDPDGAPRARRGAKRCVAGA